MQKFSNIGLSLRLKNNFKTNKFPFIFQRFLSVKSQQKVEEIDLYYGDHRAPILAMCGGACVNFCVWTGYLVNHFLFSGQPIQGIELASESTLGFIGALGTGAMIFATYMYADHSVYRSYISVDGERIGFQLYTILAKPGRKIEAKIGNVKLLSTPKKSFFNSSQIPLRVKGIKYNILLQSRGNFIDRDRLMSLLAFGEAMDEGGSINDNIVKQLKEERLDSLKEQHLKRKQASK